MQIVYELLNDTWKNRTACPWKLTLATTRRHQKSYIALKMHSNYSDERRKHFTCTTEVEQKQDARSNRFMAIFIVNGRITTSLFKLQEITALL